MRRRHFLEISAGGLLFYTLDRTPVLSAQAPPARVALRFFTAGEARTVAAAAARIFPSDSAGPGATEAGVVIYIDRQLAGPYGRDRWRYTAPPFEAAQPELGYQGQLGYQGKETPREIYRQALKPLAGFDRLAEADQDRELHRIEDTLFFALLRTHVIEGMFCDPMHGGNAGLIGWQLIGFPGPSMSFRDEVEAYYGRAFRPAPQSLEQIAGKRVRPSEDER